MAKMHAAAADRIASLGDEKQQEYLDLQDELASLNERLQDRDATLHQFEREIGSYEDTLKSEAYQIYQQGSSLTKQNASLHRQKQELEDELNSQLSPTEIKEKLTQKIKDSTAETNEMEKQIRKLESSIEKLGDTLRAKESELADAKKHSTKAKKVREGKIHTYTRHDVTRGNAIAKCPHSTDSHDPRFCHPTFFLSVCVFSSMRLSTSVMPRCKSSSMVTLPYVLRSMRIRRS